ncbi:hypothetical protein PUNSTDRAFT_134193 [Punctularia strigosozonata HHB-11173 SS5]|uniref:uncharacterized protein n=1 Tax=Punctularia strigosozonata (strain HHB-11173) TaxID=741275 RepID=UPI0004418432|nr:uncharacterized protein PUNSTDRAFT_134193 [Punctularia strigosozonata HHB-11173 SS5]EIN09020.1 hypothetical protein PUNSTDRAFT_134193 [Punctularia strigosozonata HHB-11173 SS5]
MSSRPSYGYTACCGYRTNAHFSTRVLSSPYDTCADAYHPFGYVLALLLEACLRYQAGTPHPDVVHLSAHFLRGTSLAPFTVRVRTLRTGKTFANVLADFVQGEHTNVTCHLIFGVLSPSTGSDASLSFTPPSPYAPRCPLATHPSKCPTNLVPRGHWTFRSRLAAGDDPSILARNSPDTRARIASSSDSTSSGGLESGVWLELLPDNASPSDTGNAGSSSSSKNPETPLTLTTPALAFFADAFLPSPLLLSKSELKGLKPGWFPTVTMSVDFLHPIPPPQTPTHASRTVGIYARTRFFTRPQSRHETYCEVWSAPSNVTSASDRSEQADDDGRWRDEQVCLAVSTQMSLMVARNSKEGFGQQKQKDKPKL